MLIPADACRGEAGGEAWFQRAVDAHRNGRLAEALVAFTAATEAQPALANAWNGRAVVLSELGRDAEAAEVLARAAEAIDGNASVLANLAAVLERLGRYEESIAAAERALAADASNFAAHQTLGLALLALGRPQEAAEQCRRLTELQPDCADGFLNLGECLKAADQYEEALSAYAEALRITPALTAAAIGRALTLALLRRFEDADAAFARAIEHDRPGAAACFRRLAAHAKRRIAADWRPRAIEVFLSRLWEQQLVCNWRNRDAYTAEFRRYGDILAKGEETTCDIDLAFESMAVPLSPAQRRGLLNALAAGFTVAPARRTKRRQVRVDGPLRLGFLSADFRENPAAQVHGRHFALYDRNRFRVHAYSLFDDPASPLRARIAASADVFRDLTRASAEEAAWRMARDGIDILVDLTGFSDYARPDILSHRPASISVQIGAPVSMGQLVDYRISDWICSPDDSEFSEALVRLPGAHFMFNDQQPIAEPVPSRQQCGLPAEGFVFCAFNSGFKIEPVVFDIWMELLRRVPHSVLWLRDDAPALKDNLRREAASRGISAERLVFAPWMERTAHLARHACADLFLDTLFCNAHTTATDALWAGLPVLTCAGDTMASRFAASIVSAAGLPELVVESVDDYLTLALRLAQRPDELAQLRRRLQATRKDLPVFSTASRVRYLEQAFETMWQRHCRGEKPESFSVSPHAD